MIYQDVDTVKVRLQDIVARHERGLPPADDEQEVLLRALLTIEDLEDSARRRVDGPWRYRVVKAGKDLGTFNSICAAADVAEADVVTPSVMQP